jgi:hypothetical protein
MASQQRARQRPAMSHRRCNGGGRSARSAVASWIVLALICVSAATVLYDLYLLLSGLTAGV